VVLSSAELLGDVHGEQAQLACLGQEPAQTLVVLPLQPVGGGEDLALHEVGAGGEELALLLGEALRGHERLGADRPEEEVAAAALRLLRGRGEVLDLLGHCPAPLTRCALLHWMTLCVKTIVTGMRVRKWLPGRLLYRLDWKIGSARQAGQARAQVTVDGGVRLRLARGERPR